MLPDVRKDDKETQTRLNTIHCLLPSITGSDMRWYHISTREVCNTIVQYPPGIKSPSVLEKDHFANPVTTTPYASRGNWGSEEWMNQSINPSNRSTVHVRPCVSSGVDAYRMLFHAYLVREIYSTHSCRYKNNAALFLILLSKSLSNKNSRITCIQYEWTTAHWKQLQPPIHIRNIKHVIL